MRLVVIVLVMCLLTGCAGGTAQANDTAASDGVDIDFTELPSNLVYAEVYNIIERPDDYMGKTFRLTGPYYADFYAVTGSTYHFVLIEDALACCQQGLEFRLKDGNANPLEYPDEMAQVELTGVWDCYDEEGKTYYYLQVDEIETV